MHRGREGREKKERKRERERERKKEREREEREKERERGGISYLLFRTTYGFYHAPLTQT